jgi:hypothetical protein
MFKPSNGWKIKKLEKNKCPTPGCDGRGSTRGNGKSHWSINFCPKRVRININGEKNKFVPYPEVESNAEESESSDHETNSFSNHAQDKIDLKKKIQPLVAANVSESVK